MEQRRQQLHLRKRQEMKKKMKERAAIANKAKEKEAEKVQKLETGGMQTNLKKMLMKKGTLMLDETNENSELMRKLRAWKVAKKNLENEKLKAQLEQCTPDMDDNEIKIMILKLIQTEKLLKQIYKKKKHANKK